MPPQDKQRLLAKLKAQVPVPADRLPLLDWTLRYREWLAPDRRFVPHAHIRTIYEDDCREMVIYKAAQLGASEYLVSWMLWAADVQSATGLYVFPTDTHVSDFSAARLGPAIEKAVSPYLASIIVGGAGITERGADRVGLKRVHDRFIYFRGAKVSPDGRAPQLRSIDADALVLDEFDEMDIRAPAIARKRLLASKFAQLRLASTPTYAEMGIHAEYLRSDQRQWHIPCSSCGKLHAPTLDDLVIEWDALQRPVRWNLSPLGVPFLKCPACGGALDRESGTGEWVAQYPDREVHGYHLFRLSLPGKSLAEILTALDTTDESKRQQAINQDLGLPFTPSSAQSLTDSVLDNARRDYGMEAVAKDVCYAGIDVGRVLHTVIRGTGSDGERPLRFAGMLDSFEDAGRLLKQFNVKTCVVDGLPETREVRKLQSDFQRYKVWLSYYAGDTGAATKKELLGEWNAVNGTVNVDRTRSLDGTFAAFHEAAKRAAGDGSVKNTLPANARDIREYYAQLKASQRIVRENSKGEKVAVYIESGPDHFAHAENYCNVARECPYATGWARGAAG